MVKNYKRKTDRQSWSEKTMEEAIIKVSTGIMSLGKACKAYNIAKTTLKRRLDLYRENEDLSKATTKKMGRFDRIFTQEQENELASYVKNMESRFFGLTTKDLRTMAYELAEKNKLKHNFDHSNKMAGIIWLENFLKRNPELSLRKPEVSSAARASGFNQVAVSQFFSLVMDVIDEYKLTPDRIFNVDKTSMPACPKISQRFNGAKDEKQNRSLHSMEHGKLVTTILCFAADGAYMPPMFIFPCEHLNPELMNKAPPGSWAECHESGWIQKDIFTKWFKRFVTFSKASKESPVLLLLDGHASHNKNLDVINLAHEHNVIIISFPLHCIHRLQPLDVGFMKPLSMYYSDAMERWLRTNPGCSVTQFQIAELVGKAFEKAATAPIAHNAFKVTGIWPPNPDIFTEADFIAAYTTESDQNILEINATDEPQPCCSRSLPEINIVKDVQETPGLVLTNESSSPVDSTEQDVARLILNHFSISPV